VIWFICVCGELAVGPKGMGRVKREIKKIMNATRRQATFSKRRNGLFKKANELSVLCDADVGLIVYNTAGKLFEFSSSSMKMLINKYLKHRDCGESNFSCGGESNFSCQMHACDDEMEVEKLKEDINNLSRFCRGDEVEGISLKMFEDLEQTLEMAVKCVQSRQREIFTKQVNILQNQEDKALKERGELRNQIEEIYRHTTPTRYCALVDIQGEYGENLNSEGTSSSKNIHSKYGNEVLDDFETFLTLRL